MPTRIRILSSIVLVFFLQSQIFAAEPLSQFPQNPDSYKSFNPNAPASNSSFGFPVAQSSEDFLGETLGLSSAAQTLEAESLKAEGSGWWKSSNYVLMWNNGEIVSEQDLESGIYEMEVWAIGSGNGTLPKIQMRVDGRSAQDAQTIETNSWQFTKYAFSGIELDGGLHRLAAAYVNASPGQTVAVDKIVIKKTAELPVNRVQIEAESMTMPAAGSWNSGQYVMLWANAEISKTVPVAEDGIYEIDVYASGQSREAELPKMTVKVDGLVLETNKSVGNDYWAFRKHTISGVELLAGSRQLTVAFTNQSFGRMLSIDKIVIRKVADMVPVQAPEAAGEAVTSFTIASDPNQLVPSFLPLNTSNLNPGIQHFLIREGVSDPSTIQLSATENSATLTANLATVNSAALFRINFNHPQTNKLDVNEDGFITALDALLIINHLNLVGASPARSLLQYDTNSDGWITAIDALLVINALNLGPVHPGVKTVNLNEGFPGGFIIGLDNGGTGLSEVSLEVKDIHGNIDTVLLQGITGTQKNWKILLSQLDEVDRTKILRIDLKFKGAGGQKTLNVKWNHLHETVPPNPSLVYTKPGDYRLFVRDRNENGTISNPYAFTARGVNWSPSSPGTTDLTLFQEFAKWYKTDIPLMAQMGINVVRVYQSFGLGPQGTAIMDMFYRYGIKVIMTVNSGEPDLVVDPNNIGQIVQQYKNHPALLMWAVGNEWDLNRYYGRFATMEAAAQFTEQMAQLIKSIDKNHPVTTFITDLHNESLHRLSPEAFPLPIGPSLPYTSQIVQQWVPSVDVWGFNIYRGNSFQDSFRQWKTISNKPMMIGEFGFDAYDETTGTVNQDLHAERNGKLWDETFFNLSAERTEGVSVGALAFDWADNWWQDFSVNIQNPNNHDGFHDREYFGIVDIHRNPRKIYTTWQRKYVLDQAAVQLNAAPVLRATSDYAASFDLNGKQMFWRSGGGHGGRGVNVGVLDPKTGILLETRNFDTWTGGSSHTRFAELAAYLQSLPNGAVIAIAIGEEGGFKQFNSNTPWNDPFVEQGFQALEALGSTQIRNVPYFGRWAMITVKGQGKLAENSAAAGTISVQAAVSLNALNANAGRRSDLAAPPVLQILTAIPASTPSSSFVLDYKIDGVLKQKVFALQPGSNSLTLTETSALGVPVSYSFTLQRN